MNTNEQKKIKYRYRNDESTKRKCNVTNRLMCVNKCRSSTDRPNRIEATKSWWKMTKWKLYAGTVLASREYTLYIYRRHRSKGMSFWYKNGLPTFVYCEQREKKQHKPSWVRWIIIAYFCGCSSYSLSVIPWNLVNIPWHQLITKWIWWRCCCCRED